MERLLAALDADTTAEALALAVQPRGSVAGFTVGHRSFKSEGPAVVEATDARGDRMAGADFLIVGRPIVAVPDPGAAATRLAAGCRASIL